MTIADYGLLVLMGHKYGDAGMKGVQGQCCDSYDAQGIWRIGITLDNNSIGKIFAFEGYGYKLLKPHTTSNDLKPDIALEYWEKKNKIGATVDYSKSVNDSTSWIRDHLTGSGPVTYNMLCDPTLETDMISNPPVYIAGVRIYHSEIQIIPNNRAALPDTDISDTSTEWRAILPHTSDSGCDYVSPGTEGTLHLAYSNGRITIVGRVPESNELSDTTARNTYFKNIGIETSTVPIVPTIMYELGLCPLPGTTVHGQWTGFRIGENTIQHICAFGSNSNAVNSPTHGLGYLTDFKSWYESTLSSRTRIRVPAEND